MAAISDETEELFRCFRRKTASDQDEALRRIRTYDKSVIKGLVDLKDPKGKNKSLLQWACIRGWGKVCKILIEEYECDPYYDKDTGNWTLLHNVCYNGYIDLAQYFMSEPFNMDPLKKNAQGDTPLSLAKKMDHQDVAKYLETFIG